MAVVDFAKLGIATKGLLAQTLQNLELPCHLKRFRTFGRAITELARDPDCNAVLSAPVQTLSTRHMIFLFDRHEKFLRSDGIWKNRFLLAAHFRAYFRRVPERLSCGSQVGDVKFRSSLRDSKRTTKVTLISEAHDPNSPEAFRGPISSLPHSDLADLETKAKQHLEIRLDRIESACWVSIEEHLALAQHIRERKSRAKANVESIFGERKQKPLSDCSAPAILRRIRKLRSAQVSQDDIATYVWHWVEATKLHSKPERWNQSCFLLSHGTGIAVWSEMDAGERDDRRSLFFADYFLSHRVLLSCQYLLQIHGGWNPDTVRALTSGNIQRCSDGTYVIRPFKPKTGNYLPPKHVGKRDRAHQVIELLLVHRDNVEAMAPHDNPSLFVGFQRNYRLFGLFNPKGAHKSLLQRHRLSPFSASQLRHQKANSLYLSSGRDVLLLKEYLGHADLLTVDVYLNHTIQRVLSAANMEEFTSRLHEAVQWAVNAAPRPENPTTAGLLFPIDDAVKGSVCDTWLENETAISIDAQRIAHCVWQRAFYVKNFDRLRSEDPRRFAVVHLPRIVFCVALHQVILQSSYRYLVERFESQLPGQSELAS